MNKFLATLPTNLSRILFGVWLIGMALSDKEHSPLKLNFTGVNVILGLVLVVAGILYILRK
ncbi:MAG: hypothetical protein K2R98_06370 [Gemmataceae bacterium]|nr:hypothetical protein [Gemmataceae bacterium]